MPNSAQAKELSRSRTFGAALPNFVMEAVLDQSHPNQLRLHSWDGRKATTTPTIKVCGRVVGKPYLTGLGKSCP